MFFWRNSSLQNAFALILSACCVQLTLLVNFTLRYLVMTVSIRKCPPIVCWVFNRGVFSAIVICIHLAGWKDIFQSDYRLSKGSRYYRKLTWSSSLSVCLYRNSHLQTASLLSLWSKMAGHWYIARILRVPRYYLGITPDISLLSAIIQERGDLAGEMSSMGCKIPLKASAKFNRITRFLTWMKSLTTCQEFLLTWPLLSENVLWYWVFFKMPVDLATDHMFH